MTLSLLAVGLLGSAPSLAAPPARDLNWLALQWTRGIFKAPLVCEIEGVAHRGFRRVVISPGPRSMRPPVNRLRFHDLEVPAGTDCVTETRGPTPNVLGSLAFLRRGTSRVDTADHDFSLAMRKDAGFEFEIVGGRLRVGPSADPSAMREIEFSGGRARLTLVRPGTDAFRRLADFPGRRKLKLVLEAPDGSRLEFDLVHFEPR